MMILLAEFSTLPRTEIKTPYTNTTQKDFRPVLQNIKTIHEHLLDEKAERQTLLVKRLFGVPEPTNGPMAVLSQMEEVRTPYLGQFDITAVTVPTTWDTDWLLEIIEQDPSVKYAYKEPKMQPFGVWPNDPAFENQTNLHDPVHDVDIDAPEAWAYTTGSDSVVIAVLDISLDTGHLDLRPNLWVNSSEIRGNEIDDDNNGCRDDIHGCNLFSNTAGYRTGNIEGSDGHGTRVSSILARGNNDYAITGVTWNTRIMFVGGGVGEGLEYVMNMRDRGVNVRVVNHSKGNVRRCNPHVDCDANPSDSECNMQDQIRMAGEKGILFVQAIGNSNINYEISTQTQISPGCLKTDNMIVVAGQSEISRTRWVDTDFANHGSNYGANVADLYAPAENLHYLNRSLPNGYIDIGAGTSHATPHVAAAAALLWSFKPDLTVTEVRNVLLSTVDRFPNYAGEVASGGALNIANALYSVATPGIRIHSSQTTIAEGTSGYIDLSLTREPVRPSSGEVVVLEGIATPLSDADAIVTPSTLTFTSRNWHIPQRMTVRAAGTSGSEITLQVSVNDEQSTTDYRTMVRTATMTLQSEGIRPTLHIPQRITEGNIATATIQFSDRLLNAAQFTITTTGAGTAVEGEHYTLPGPVTAEADSTSATFTIQTMDNAGYNGPDKTIHLQITTENPRISPQALPLQATLTIEDSDTPVMTITVLPRTISQSNTQANAPTATATITLDRMAVQDVTFSLNARPIGGGDINHLFNDISRNTWPVTATIVEDATATEIIIHSIDEDDVEGRTHWIRLYPAIPRNAAARLGQPNRALLITRDDDGDSSTYLRLRVFLEGAVLTNTTTIQTNP
ncbi:MAG: S8 family serine peptidase [Gammaproteobacteria bacterium]|nr:S8 family serine peptidase [Gammaproteobacteria bacterium]